MQDNRAIAGILSVPFNAGNFTASGAMTWTVTAPEVHCFKIVTFATAPFLALVIFTVVGSTTGGVADTTLKVQLPAGFVSSIETHIVGHTDTGAGAETGHFEFDPTSSILSITRLAGGNFGLSAAAEAAFQGFFIGT
jgi:hypothetical protein